MVRQILLDTETTGLSIKDGHRIIEIGCVEMIDRRITGNDYHQYIQPDREIDAGALKVHGITPEFLADKPRFAEIATDFVNYVQGAELIIHNAPFDVGFLNYELELTGVNNKKLTQYCTIIDTLVMARKMFPGKKNSLDALCKRYFINNSHRQLHGALLDSSILADVYLAMTGGQIDLMLGQQHANRNQQNTQIQKLNRNRAALKIISANAIEMTAHQERLQAIEKISNKNLWSFQ